MKVQADRRARIAGLLATLAMLLCLATTNFVYAADRTVIGELWSADG
ncbi:MAG: hypothetical protein IPP62_17060 [bacterium]|jgi:hypothetical protein|nr:hypothetical protein [bacterium]